MAQFKSIEAEAVGTTPIQLSEGANPYQTPASTIDVLTSLQVANRTGNTTISVDVYLVRGAKTIYLVKGANIVAGGAEDVLAGKPIMIAGDQLWLVSSVESSADAWCSFMNDNA